MHFDVKLNISPASSDPKVLEFRDFSKLDQLAFKNDLLNSPLCNESFDCSLDDAVIMYHKILNDLMDKHCPVQGSPDKKKTS